MKTSFAIALENDRVSIVEKWLQMITSRTTKNRSLVASFSTFILFCVSNFI